MPISIKNLLAWGKEQLHRYDTAGLDAEVLLANVLNFSRAQLYTRMDAVISMEQKIAYEHAIARRQKGEPIAYIVGAQEFWSLSLTVSPAVLIPRPETEGIIECVLQKLPKERNCRIVDLGTGSGAIALAVASTCPNWWVVATDKSADALAVARLNADKLAIPNVEFKLGDWCDVLAGEKYDAILSNPPYVDHGDSNSWPANLAFEPSHALFAEEQGLADLKIIISQAKNYLKPGGWLILEHGYKQSEPLRNILVSAGYNAIESHKDLANLERIAVAQFC